MRRRRYRWTTIRTARTHDIQFDDFFRVPLETDEIPSTQHRLEGFVSVQIFA